VRKNLFLIKNFSALCGTNWLLSYSSLPLAGETTEGEAGCEDFFSSLLELCSFKKTRIPLSLCCSYTFGLSMTVMLGYEGNLAKELT
jgi:hypothetical protein